VVCDNTAEAARSEDGQEFKVKHTKYSGYRINDAREALQIVHTMADDFAEEVARLTAWKVSDKQFQAHLTQMVPINDELSKIALTNGEKKRAEIVNLYNEDERCAPWKGTAYGVAQTWNTWGQHHRKVRGETPRYVRNMENLLKGNIGAEDRHVLDILGTVCK
jgi:phage/plasmid-like protein (TIGR03299 family)